MVTVVVSLAAIGVGGEVTGGQRLGLVGEVDQCVAVGPGDGGGRFINFSITNNNPLQHISCCGHAKNTSDIML